MISAKRSIKRSKRGFTLIELLIVLTVIGLLAALAVPTFLKVTRNWRSAALGRDIRTLATASETYILESGLWPPDTTSGSFPNEMLGYFSERFFESATPMGGRWDFEQFDSGVTSAVGVVSPTLDEEDLAKTDEIIDDENLATGQFRKLADDRYFWVIAD
ncbi:MAG TPA: hypothetical protein DIV79_08220 [Opitutae bacterium]|nr:hypothetical protein [Opitutaceae bacterium]HCR29985.1 hypothetical protein [Opitutae bacterium]|tara:strand:+ start:29 stop:508 length:480 start_codon:yes stop_codon:yes gene_type:complete